MKPLEIPTRSCARLARPVGVIGWGAFKIGRNQGAKYPQAYDLPSEAESIELVRDIIAMGIYTIDTAPAYGLSEERLGHALASLDSTMRAKIFLSTKVGEEFSQSQSHYDFSRSAISASVARSLVRLQCASVDLVFVHSNGSDMQILHEGGALDALEICKSAGSIGAIGFSPKSLEGAHAVLRDPRIDALMVEFHHQSQEMKPVLERAHELGKAIFIKKPLASGTLDPSHAIPWILRHSAVSCVVVGGLSLERLRANASLAI